VFSPLKEEITMKRKSVLCLVLILSIIMISQEILAQGFSRRPVYRRNFNALGIRNYPYNTGNRVIGPGPCGMGYGILNGGRGMGQGMGRGTMALDRGFGMGIGRIMGYGNMGYGRGIMGYGRNMGYGRGFITRGNAYYPRNYGY